TILVQFADVKKGALLRKLLRHFIWYGGWSFMPRQFYVKDKHPRCGKCQRWGHGTRQCWADRPTCVYCGENHYVEDHSDVASCCQSAASGQICPHPPKCANCLQEHQASWRGCSFAKHAGDQNWIRNKY
ncbi:hypothetical protein BD779DRAFT_1378384, partial [Infundibulicybe gibba]